MPTAKTTPGQIDQGISSPPDEVDIFLQTEGTRIAEARAEEAEEKEAVRMAVEIAARPRPTTPPKENLAPTPKAVFKPKSLVPAVDQDGKILPGRFVTPASKARQKEFQNLQPMPEHPLKAAGFTRASKSDSQTTVWYPPGHRPFSQTRINIKRVDDCHTDLEYISPERLLEILLDRRKFYTSGIGANSIKLAEIQQEIVALLEKNPELMSRVSGNLNN